MRFIRQAAKVLIIGTLAFSVVGCCGFRPFGEGRGHGGRGYGYENSGSQGQYPDSHGGWQRH